MTEIIIILVLASVTISVARATPSRTVSITSLVHVKKFIAFPKRNTHKHTYTFRDAKQNYLPCAKALSSDAISYIDDIKPVQELGGQDLLSGGYDIAFDSSAIIEILA